MRIVPENHLDFFVGKEKEPDRHHFDEELTGRD
jgi:hypothetical protein